jgi:hypothetical protein
MTKLVVASQLVVIKEQLNKSNKAGNFEAD